MNNNIATSKKKANITGMVFGIIATLVFAGLLIWECVQFIVNLSSNFEWMIESVKYLEYGYAIENFVKLITYNVLIPISYAIFLLLLIAYSLTTVIMKGYGNKILYFVTFIAGIIYSSVLTVSIILEAAMNFMSGEFSGGLMMIFLFAIPAAVVMIIGLLIAGLAGLFRKKVLYIIFGIAGAISFLVSRMFDVVSFLFMAMLWCGGPEDLLELLNPSLRILEILSPRIFEITSLTIASIAIVVVVLFLHPKSKERK